VRVRAPGKMMLAGEYAILHGGAAWVMAVDRHAVVSDAPRPLRRVPIEARAALAIAVREKHIAAFPEHWTSDVTALGDGAGRKLGLGSSAAGCVAALGWAFARAGHDLTDPRVRDLVAGIARRGHREAQGGGSGVDVLASAQGAVISVAFPHGVTGEPAVRRHAGFDALPWAVLWSGSSARTSEMLARVDALKTADGEIFRARIGDIVTAAAAMGAALDAGDAGAMVLAVRAHGAAMGALGAAAGAPIVTEALGRFGAALEPLGASVKPSGAGGGDVSLLVAQDRDALAAALSLAPAYGFDAIALSMDREGVRVI